jgi:quercetin dioxygenase-like cupin family protein
MNRCKHVLWFTAFLILIAATAHTQQPQNGPAKEQQPPPAFASTGDTPARKELRRTDLSGAPNMEVVVSILELKPGAESPAHLHHGVETGYVLEGGMIEVPGKPISEMKTGAPIMNLRDVPHAGYKVVGDKTIKLFTVHIVDKGKPLYDWIEK